MILSILNVQCVGDASSLNGFTVERPGWEPLFYHNCILFMLTQRERWLFDVFIFKVFYFLHSKKYSKLEHYMELYDRLP